MAKEPKINFADLRDGRDVQKVLGLNPVEYMRHINKLTRSEGMPDREHQKFCEKIFNHPDQK